MPDARRVDGTPRQFPLFDLGRIDTEDGKKKFEQLSRAMVAASDVFHLLSMQNDLRAEDAKEYGPALIFRSLWDKTGLEQVIAKESECLGTEFSLADAVFNMTLNRLCAPSSKRRLERWQQDIHGIPAFSLHQYYRAMDYLIEHKDSIEQRLFERMKDLFHLGVELLLFDTTSLVYHGEGDKGETLLAHGFSKAKRSDLKQIVVGVIMSGEGVPLGHEVFSGNQNDVTCFREIIDKIAKRFRIRRVVLIGDRGMVSQKNIRHLEENGYEYVLGYRMRTIPKQDRASVLSKAKLKIADKDTLHWRRVDYEGQRLLVCYNPERAKLDEKKRQDILERLREKIKSAVDVKAIVTHIDFKKFLRIEGKKPEIDPEKVSRDSLYDGLYVLTSNSRLGDSAVIESYKSLWQVEAAFRQLKTEIALGPVFHWRDRRIRAHVMICFLALVLRVIFYKKLREHYPEASYADTLSDMRSLRVLRISIHGQPVTLRTELRPGAMQAIKSLGLRSPPRVLSSETASNLLI